GRPLGHILLRDAWLLFHQAAVTVRASLWKARTVPGFASPCWRGCVPVLHVMRAHVLRVCSYAPALTGRGFGVASGATGLVPAFLSGLAQCRKQCPSL